METQYFIGQPVLHSDMANHRVGYIVDIQKPEHETLVFGASGLEPVHFDLTIAWDEGELSTLGCSTSDRFVEAAKNLPTISEAEAKQKQAEALSRQKARIEEDHKKEQQAQEKRDLFLQQVREKMPSWAKAVIVANYHVSDTDYNTDYFGHHTTNTLILAWSKHTRDIFSEMRKAALNSKETASMAEDYEEHREKYSMGGGYYLTKSGGYRHHTGWTISKIRLCYGDNDPRPESVPVGEWRIPENQPKKSTQAKNHAISPATSAHIEQHMHTKKGFLMYMVVLDVSLERDDFNSMRDLAKDFGGWYSRKWGSTPGGFAFKEQDQADHFLQSISNDNPTDEPPKPTKGVGSKLRTIADKMTSQIENKLADRLTNTPKRLAQANHARLDGEKLQRTQQALYALADLHDSGEVPNILRRFTTKASVFDLMGTKKEPIPNGYHTYHVCTGEPINTGPESAALWSLISGKSDEEKKADELRRKIDGLQFSNIPGYFPTPEAVIDIMIDYADIQPDHRVLEPEIGSCAIADRVAPLCAEVKGYEINYTLAEIADLKDYLIERRDFLDVAPEEICSVDRILMNPPFENLQDIDHVRYAFQFLKPGGRLVSVMSPGPFFRQDKKCKEFRDWVNSLGGEVVDLPDQSFKESGTSINTKLLILDNSNV